MISTQHAQSEITFSIRRQNAHKILFSKNDRVRKRYRLLRGERKRNSIFPNENDCRSFLPTHQKPACLVHQIKTPTEENSKDCSSLILLPRQKVSIEGFLILLKNRFFTAFCEFNTNISTVV
jgi:hypothetical protein